MDYYFVFIVYNYAVDNVPFPGGTVGQTYRQERYNSEKLFGLTEAELRRRIVIPFHNNKPWLLSGNLVNRSQIYRVFIFWRSELLSKEYIESDEFPGDIFAQIDLFKNDVKIGAKDVTERFLLEPESPESFGSQKLDAKASLSSDELLTKVFVVHGRDELMKQVVARTIEQLCLKPIILHEQADQGRTVIEKFTECSDVGYAVVLLSPDDFGYPKEAQPEKRRLRARQNVILELGYFIGKLGRKKVMALYRETENFEMPTDFAGVVYTPFDANEYWRFKLVKELKACGYKVSADQLL